MQWLCNEEDRKKNLRLSYEKMRKKKRKGGKSGRNGGWERRVSRSLAMDSRW